MVGASTTGISMYLNKVCEPTQPGNYVHKYRPLPGPRSGKMGLACSSNSMEVVSQNNSAPNSTALDSLRSFLQQVLRITTVDSRVFMGIFAGTDKPLNIILINAEEYRIFQNPGQKVEVIEGGRYVGQVLLPWKMIVKVEVHESDDALKKKGKDRRDNTYL